MSALEERVSDDENSVDKVKYLNRSISALLEYDALQSNESSPRAGAGPNVATQAALKQQLISKLSGLDNLDDGPSSDDNAPDRKEERRRRRNGGANKGDGSNFVTPVLTGGDDNSSGDSQGNDLDQVEKYRSSRSGKPAKRLSFHATPKSARSARRSFNAGDTGGSGEGGLNTAGSGILSSGGLHSPSSNAFDYAPWNDFKSSDSFYTPSGVMSSASNAANSGSLSGRSDNGRNKAINQNGGALAELERAPHDHDNESFVGSNAGSHVEQGHNVILKGQQFDVDGNTSVIGDNGVIRLQNNGNINKGLPHDHGMDDQYDSDNVQIRFDESNDSDDHNNFYSGEANAKRKKKRVKKVKVKPHHLFDTLKLPQAVDLAGNLAVAVSQTFGKDNTPKTNTNTNPSMSSPSPARSNTSTGSRLSAFIPNIVIPDMLKSFAASSSSVNKKNGKRNGFASEEDNDNDNDSGNYRNGNGKHYRGNHRRTKDNHAANKGMGRFKFFTAKLGRDSNSSNEDTEPESIGNLDEFDDNDHDDGYFHIGGGSNSKGGISGKSPHSLISEDFRDNESVADTIVDSDEFSNDFNNDDMGYRNRNNRSNDDLNSLHSSQSGSSYDSEDTDSTSSIDDLDPRYLQSSVPLDRRPGNKFNSGDHNSGLTWRTYWSNFRARKYNFLSLDEEEEDRQIDNEIDNFIVPDELGELHLSGKTTSGSGYVFIDDGPAKVGTGSTLPPIQVSTSNKQQPGSSKSSPAPSVRSSASKMSLKRSMSDMDGLIDASSPYHPRRTAHASDGEDIDGALDALTVENVDDGDLSDGDDFSEEAKKVLSENILQHIQNHIPFHVIAVPSGGLSARSAVARKSPVPHVHSASQNMLPVGAPASANKLRLMGVDLSLDLNMETLNRSRSFDNTSQPPNQLQQQIQQMLLAPSEPPTPAPPSPVSADEFRAMILSVASGSSSGASSVDVDLRRAKKVIEDGRVSMSKEEATELLLQCVENIETINEPLELFMLLVDSLGADTNARDALGNCPLHTLFNKPILGRFLITRGADILARDCNGDSVLQLCLEYGYEWIVPAISSTGRENAILEDPVRAKDYALSLLTFGGYGVKVRELIEDAGVVITADEALDIMDKVQGNYDSLKDPVETFELLEELILA
jgi:hypothetical protein